ncbi:TMEM199 family protein, partial [Lecanoromycetidae sp. Uapishka_2]
MVRLTMNKAVVQALKHLQHLDQSLDTIENASQPSLNNPAVGLPISHDQIIAISKKLKQAPGASHRDEFGDAISFHLDDLLRGSRVYVEPPKPKAEPVAAFSAELWKLANHAQSSEYKVLMARLRREEEAQAYERMLNPSQPPQTFSQRFPATEPNLFPVAQADVGEDDEISYADINRQMALIINILISIVACSVAIWMAARHWSTPSRLGLSMGGSGMIGAAEVVVYAGYLRRLKEAREKGKKEVEVKEIIGTWVAGGVEKRNSNHSQSIGTKASHDERIRRRKPVPK